MKAYNKSVEFAGTETLKESKPRLRHSNAREGERDDTLLWRLITDAASTGEPLRDTDRDEDKGRANHEI